jgi:hypothetical protein
MRRYIVSALVLASAAAFGTAARAAIPEQPGVRAIAGTYTCVTHDVSGQTWRFTSVNTMWGEWLRAETTFAPQNGQRKRAGQTFVGFDAAAKRWNIVSLDAGGSYYTRSSASPEFPKSRWVDGFPADGGTAVIGTPRPGQYTFDFTAGGTNGRRDVSHTVCTRR